MRHRALASLALLAACATPHASGPHGVVPTGTPDAVNIALARVHGGAARVAWQPWSRETFETARRQRRYVLLDGAAEWCHWCHVMDETTYRDPAVVRDIEARFVPVRVDIDSRPDLAARYAEYGWPATIVLGPDGDEVVKLRGYLPPARLRAVLADVDRLAVAARTHHDDDTDAETGEPPLADGALGDAARAALHAMDGFYDPVQGSWGTWQKLALGANVEIELRRAMHGDTAARERARFTLGRQRALIDPVWGGVYQYSAGASWDDPHFEKLMAFQAPNLEACARGAVVLDEPSLHEDARHIDGYLANFLTDRDGAFLPSQDADVNAHDATQPFVDGHVYHAHDDRGRRALGMPRIDPHVYARENGLAIAALCTLYETDHDAAVLLRARRAADVLLRTHVADDGAVRHQPGDGADAVRYLADAAAFGRALTRLADVTGDTRYRARAMDVARAMRRDFADGDTGLLFAQTPDPARAGAAFAHRLHPVRDNAMAVRLLATLARITHDETLATEARARLAAVATPRRVASVGRFVGELLLAFDDAGALPWTPAEAPVAAAAGFAAVHAVVRVEYDRATTTLTVRAEGRDGFHVNDRFPAALDLSADRAEVPAHLTRREATTVDAHAVVFTVAVHPTASRPVVHGTLRYAVCGEVECLPASQSFTVGDP